MSILWYFTNILRKNPNEFDLFKGFDSIPNTFINLLADVTAVNDMDLLIAIDPNLGKEHSQGNKSAGFTSTCRLREENTPFKVVMIPDKGFKCNTILLDRGSKA